MWNAYYNIPTHGVFPVKQPFSDLVMEYEWAFLRKLSYQGHREASSDVSVLMPNFFNKLG